MDKVKDTFQRGVLKYSYPQLFLRGSEMDKCEIFIAGVWKRGEMRKSKITVNVRRIV